MQCTRAKRKMAQGTKIEDNDKDRKRKMRQNLACLFLLRKIYTLRLSPKVYLARSFIFFSPSPPFSPPPNHPQFFHRYTVFVRRRFDKKKMTSR